MKHNPFVQPLPQSSDESCDTGPWYLKFVVFGIMLVVTVFTTNFIFNRIFVRLDKESHVIVNGFSEVKTLAPGYHFRGLDEHWTIFPASPQYYAFETSGVNVHTGERISVTGGIVYEFKPKNGSWRSNDIQYLLYPAVKRAIAEATAHVNSSDEGMLGRFGPEFKRSVSSHPALERAGVTVMTVNLTEVKI